MNTTLGSSLQAIGCFWFFESHKMDLFLTGSLNFKDKNTYRVDRLQLCGYSETNYLPMKNSAIPIIMGNFACHNIRSMQSSKKSRSKRYKTVTNAINVIESSDENNQQEKFGQLVHFLNFYSSV